MTDPAVVVARLAEGGWTIGTALGALLMAYVPRAARPADVPWK